MATWHARHLLALGLALLAGLGCSSGKGGKKGHKGAGQDADASGLGERGLVELASSIAPEQIQNLRLVAKGGADETILITRDGGAWRLDERAGTMSDISVRTYGEAEQMLLVASDRTVWTCRSDEVARSAETVKDGHVLLGELPGFAVAQPESEAPLDACELVKGLSPNLLVAADASRAHVYRFDGSALKVEEIALGQPFFDDSEHLALAAGEIEGGGYWFHTKAGLVTARPKADGGFTWAKAPLTLGIDAAALDRVRSIAMRVVQSEEGVRIEGAIVVLTEAGLLISPARGATPPDIQASLGRLNWVEDVKPIAASFCSGCHDGAFDLDSEDVWRANKDKIMSRVNVAAKKDAITMPPPDSKEARDLSDGQRKTLVSWLMQPPVEASGGSAGGGEEEPGEAPTVKPKIEGEFKTLVTTYCIACHGAGNYVEWWTARKTNAIERIRSRAMPQPSSAQATAIDKVSGARERLIELIQGL